MTREEYERHLENAIDAAMQTHNKELARLRDIIHRAGVQFFHDGPDGETAAKMLAVLNEADAPKPVD